jgi:hypothetical protein
MTDTPPWIGGLSCQRNTPGVPTWVLREGGGSAAKVQVHKRNGPGKLVWVLREGPGSSGEGGIALPAEAAPMPGVRGTRPRS